MVKKFATVGKKLLNRILSGELHYQGTYDGYTYFTLPEWENSCLVRMISGGVYADSDSVSCELAAGLESPQRFRDLPGTLKYLVNSVDRSHKGYLVHVEKDPVYLPSNRGRGGVYVKVFRNQEGQTMVFCMSNKIYNYLCAEDVLIYYYPDVRCFILQASETAPWSILIMPVIGTFLNRG